MAKRTYLRPYKSYVFRDKDPVIDKVRTLVEDSGLKYKEIHKRSNVSLGTMQGWFNGRTRRPQFCTIAAVAATCGQELIFRSKSPNKR